MNTKDTSLHLTPHLTEYDEARRMTLENMRLLQERLFEHRDQMQRDMDANSAGVVSPTTPTSGNT